MTQQMSIARRTQPLRHAKHFPPLLAATVVLWTTVCSFAQAEGLMLYVAPSGSDAWSGRLAEPENGDGPFLTMQRARDEIRKLRKAGGLPVGGVVVDIRGGVYQLAAPVELSAEDSGDAGSPIVYRARQGEKIRLVGGVQVTNFQPVSDPAVLKRLAPSVRGKVFQTNLTELKIKDLGDVVGANRLELFFQDRPMTLARWPNKGFTRIVDVVGGQPVTDYCTGFVGDKIGKFTYEDNRPNRWIGEQDGWLHGYWFWDWSDQRHKIESIDTTKRMISLIPPYHHYGYRKGQWYYAFNLLSEIDSPGEWYLDRSTAILYFWPPAPLDRSEAIVSIIPTLFRLENASHVEVRGMTLEACRGTAIVANGVNDVRIIGCTIRNTGDFAVTLSGVKSGVTGCDIYDTANGGINLYGGDRRTLTPGDLWADNNHIRDYSRWTRAYQPGIALGGVGNRATHNLIHDAPHQAIALSGNDHLIEYNDIHDVCRESNDAGAIYAGRNWTMRGNVIRHNYFHDINGYEGRGCSGIYLDDQFSSADVYGNLFYNVWRAMNLNGGRDCSVVNNIFVDCPCAIYVSARGLVFPDCTDQLMKGLDEVPYRDSVWAARYPELANILEDDPMTPKGNIIARNICTRGNWIYFDEKAKPFFTVQDNIVDQDPKFVDPNRKNFQLKDSSPAYKLGFQRIPLEKIGLYQDPQRASWPVRNLITPTSPSK